jgi:cellulose biosynthesis protein BcsQ
MAESSKDRDIKMLSNRNILAIFTHKGGVGKTTLTSNITRIPSLAGKKILIIDGDPQSNVSQCFTSPAMLYALERDDDYATIEDLINDTPKNIYKPQNPELRSDVSIIFGAHVTASNEMSFHNEQSTPNPDRTNGLINRIRIMSQRFDLVLIDMNPSFSSLNMVLLMSVDHIISLTTSDQFSQDACLRLEEKVKMFPKKRKGAISGEIIEIHKPRIHLVPSMIEQSRDSYSLHNQIFMRNIIKMIRDQNQRHIANRVDVPMMQFQGILPYVKDSMANRFSLRLGDMIRSNALLSSYIDCIDKLMIRIANGLALDIEESDGLFPWVQIFDGSRAYNRKIVIDSKISYNRFYVFISDDGSFYKYGITHHIPSRIITNRKTTGQRMRFIMAFKSTPDIVKVIEQSFKDYFPRHNSLKETCSSHNAEFIKIIASLPDRKFIERILLESRVNNTSVDVDGHDTVHEDDLIQEYESGDEMIDSDEEDNGPVDAVDGGDDMGDD